MDNPTPATFAEAAAELIRAADGWFVEAEADVEISPLERGSWVLAKSAVFAQLAVAQETSNLREFLETRDNGRTALEAAAVAAVAAAEAVVMRGRFADDTGTLDVVRNLRETAKALRAVVGPETVNRIKRRG